MTTHTIGVIMNGVTGRMGLNQHLRRSIYAIIQQGGVRVSESEVIMPQPLLVGRSASKLDAISKECGGLEWTTNLDKALADGAYQVYFDAQTTDRRAEAVRAAIAAGKHVYSETVPAQRPSWNYRKEDGGGIILDMLCHWRYVLDNLFGEVKAVSCLGATHVPTRWDEAGHPYSVTADDSAYATFELAGGIVAHINSSWVVRVRRDDLVTFQVDGSKGTAVAGLRHCWIQPYGATPRPIWNPDIEQPIDFFHGWQKVPEQASFDNAFKHQWELFLRHVAKDEPFRWGLLEGAKGVQLAELGLESWRKRAWVDVPALAVE